MGLLIAWSIGDHFTTTVKLPAPVLLHPAGGRAFLKLTYQTLSGGRAVKFCSALHSVYGEASQLLPHAATHLERFVVFFFLSSPRVMGHYWKAKLSIQGNCYCGIWWLIN